MVVDSLASSCGPSQWGTVLETFQSSCGRCSQSYGCPLVRSSLQLCSEGTQIYIYIYNVKFKTKRSRLCYLNALMDHDIYFFILLSCECALLKIWRTFFGRCLFCSLLKQTKADFRFIFTDRNFFLFLVRSINHFDWWIKHGMGLQLLHF